MRKSIHFLIGLLSLMMLIHCGTVYSDSSEPPPVPVETQTPTVENLAVTLKATGTLLAKQSVIITPQSPGRITRIHKSSSDHVKEGELLVELDDALLQAEIAQIKAKVDYARQNHQRLEQLTTSGSAKASERDEALKQLKVEEASLDYLEAKIAQTRLDAPFTGVLGLLNVEVGDYVVPGQTLVTLESMDTLRVDFHVPEIYLNQLKQGQSFDLEFDGLPGQLFVGRVTAIQPHADDNHSFVVRGGLTNTEHQLRPGLFVRVNLEVAHRDNALLVPEHAIVLSAQGPYLYRVDEGKAEKVMIKTGLRKPGWVEVVEGINTDDSIIISGQNKLYPQASVYSVSP